MDIANTVRWPNILCQGDSDNTFVNLDENGHIIGISDRSLKRYGWAYNDVEFTINIPNLIEKNVELDDQIDPNSLSLNPKKTLIYHNKESEIILPSAGLDASEEKRDIRLTVAKGNNITNYIISMLNDDESIIKKIKIKHKHKKKNIKYYEYNRIGNVAAKFVFKNNTIHSSSNYSFEHTDVGVLFSKQKFENGILKSQNFYNEYGIIEKTEYY
jgi:hypothetical protein